MSKIEQFLKELMKVHEDDAIAPGLQIAWLTDKEQFYVALHTFPMGTMDSRKVVAKALAPTVDEGVQKVADLHMLQIEWLGQPETDANGATL